MPAAFFGGCERALLWLFDSTTGAATGTQSTLSAGSTSGAYVISKVRDSNFSYENPESLQQRAGDKLGSILSFSASKLGQFTITIDEYDTALQALIEQSTANTTNSEFTKVASNPDRAQPLSCGVAIQQRGVTSAGAQIYRTVFIPSCEVSIQDGGGSFRGESLVTLVVTPRLGRKAHTGQGYGASGLAYNLTNDTTDSYSWYSDNPLHIVSFKQNGSGTTFNTIYKPLSTTVTLNATPNELVINGTPTALSALTLAGEATLAAAGTSGHIDVLTHETAYVPV